MQNEPCYMKTKVWREEWCIGGYIKKKSHVSRKLVKIDHRLNSCWKTICYQIWIMKFPVQGSLMPQSIWTQQSGYYKCGRLASSKSQITKKKNKKKRWQNWKAEIVRGDYEILKSYGSSVTKKTTSHTHKDTEDFCASFPKNIKVVIYR